MPDLDALVTELEGLDTRATRGPWKFVRVKCEQSELGKKEFPNDGRFGKLKEEVDELFEAHRAADEDGLRMEAADVAIVLMHLAEVAGFDLMLAVQEKMAINRARDWKARLAAKREKVT